MEEYHFVQSHRALEQMLIDVAGPFGFRLVAQNGVEFQIASRTEACAEVRDVADQARRPVQLCCRPLLYVVSEEQVMGARGRYDGANFAESVECALGVGIKFGQGMQKQAAAGEFYHRHASADFCKAGAEVRLVNDPEIRRKIFRLRHEK